MKSLTILKTLTALLMLILVIACEPKKSDESVDIAKESNDAVLDNRDDEKDADFIVNTIAANYYEVKLAKLAMTRSSDTGVKEMATMLETDHNRIINELKGYAAKNGITVPLEETEEQKNDINDLAAESDTNKFDEKWCDMLQDKHEATVNNFESRLNKTEDVELKNWITATLPALRSHLEMLEKHEERLK
jgi:putative membrane protein